MKSISLASIADEPGTRNGVIIQVILAVLGVSA